MFLFSCLCAQNEDVGCVSLDHVMVFFNCELYNSVVRSNILFSDFDCLL